MPPRWKGRTFLVETRRDWRRVRRTRTRTTGERPSDRGGGAGGRCFRFQSFALMSAAALCLSLSVDRCFAEVRSVSQVYHSACLERGQSYWDYENFQLSSIDWDEVDRYEVTGRLGFGRFSEARKKCERIVYCFLRIYGNVQKRVAFVVALPSPSGRGSNRVSRALYSRCSAGRVNPNRHSPPRDLHRTILIG